MESTELLPIYLEIRVRHCTSELNSRLVITNWVGAVTLEKCPQECSFEFSYGRDPEHGKKIEGQVSETTFATADVVCESGVSGLTRRVIAHSTANTVLLGFA